MWIVTRSINEYNQDGEYFETSYIKKPTLGQLILYFNDAKLAAHLLKGGGRQDSEDWWFYLTEVKEGEEYKSNI